MKSVNIDVPILGMIAGTRGILGAGIGLLVADRLSPERRRAVGWTLLAVGALLSLPLAAQVFRGDQAQRDGAPDRLRGRMSGATDEKRSEAGI